jgi:hypothetical protein
MNNTRMESRMNGELYDYHEDFTALSALERRVILEHAKNLLKVQKEGWVNGEPCDYGKDFKGLSAAERRGVLKTARRLLKIQRENIALAEILPARSLDAARHGPYRTAAPMEAETT